MGAGTTGTVQEAKPLLTLQPLRLHQVSGKARAARLGIWLGPPTTTLLGLPSGQRSPAFPDGWMPPHYFLQSSGCSVPAALYYNDAALTLWLRLSLVIPDLPPVGFSGDGAVCSGPLHVPPIWPSGPQAIWSGQTLGPGAVWRSVASVGTGATGIVQGAKSYLDPATVLSKGFEGVR